MEKWSSESTTNVILEFKIYECLWNTKSATCKLKHMQSSMEKSLEGFGVPEAKEKTKV